MKAKTPSRDKTSRNADTAQTVLSEAVDDLLFNRAFMQTIEAKKKAQAALRNRYSSLASHHTILLVGFDLKEAQQEADNIFQYAWDIRGINIISHYDNLLDCHRITSPPTLFIPFLASIPQDYIPRFQNILTKPHAHVVAAIDSRGSKYECLFDHILTKTIDSDKHLSNDDQLAMVTRFYTTYLEGTETETDKIRQYLADDIHLPGLESGVYTYLDRCFPLQFTVISVDNFKRMAKTLPWLTNPGKGKIKTFSSRTAIKWWLVRDMMR
jgi:hypothetical protein